MNLWNNWVINILFFLKKKKEACMNIPNTILEEGNYCLLPLRSHKFCAIKFFVGIEYHLEYTPCYSFFQQFRPVFDEVTIQ